MFFFFLLYVIDLLLGHKYALEEKFNEYLSTGMSQLPQALAHYQDSGRKLGPVSVLELLN